MKLISAWRKAVLLMAIATGAACSTAMAQEDWPTRPVTIVVPFGPGASNDNFTRAIANVLTPALGQPIVVENRAGAGGFTGVLSVAEGAADGYTFIESPNSIVSYGPVQKLDFDALTDVVPVAMIARSPVSMAIPTTLPVTSLEELIPYANDKPGELFYGVVGQASLGALLTEKFVHSAGLDMVGVEYKSANDAILDLVAGRIHVFFSSPSSLAGQVEAGQLRIVAYSGPPDPDTMPVAPTFAEAGIEGVEGDAWWGVFAPAGTPQDIVSRMNSEINKALVDPTVGDFLKAAGATPQPISPEAFGQVVVNDIEMLTRIVTELGLEIGAAQ